LSREINEMIMKNKVECPQCIGVGVIFTPDDNAEIICKLCKGKGTVSEEIEEAYNPLGGGEEYDN